MTRSALVLGAGMVGTCTALQLTLRGHQVTLVDRRPPGQETSYGNAGVIQREMIEPPAFPRRLGMLLQVALGQRAEVRYRLDALPQLFGPLLRYFSASAPQNYARISRAFAALIERSTLEHQPLIALSGAETLVSKEGFRYLYREDASFKASVSTAQRLHADTQLEFRVLSPDEVAADEPALLQRIAGGVLFPQAWPVNTPGELVHRYADAFVREGGRLLTGDALTLKPAASGTGWQVDTAEGTVEAEHAVVALGPWASRLVQPLGYRLPLFVKRGYHRHYQSRNPPRHAYYDADRGLCVCPMSQGVRITTGAEFALQDAPPSAVQIQLAENAARQWLDLGEPVEPTPWLGARPCTADMLPVIGPAPRHTGLWFNFGHAHQGFTLGAVCGRLISEMIDGETPVIDPAPYAPTRFG